MYIQADNRLIRELREAGFDIDFRLLIALYRASRMRSPASPPLAMGSAKASIARAGDASSSCALGQHPDAHRSASVPRLLKSLLRRVDR